MTVLHIDNYKSHEIWYEKITAKETQFFLEEVGGSSRSQVPEVART